MIEIFKNIATVIGCVSACITLAMTLVKPFRKWMVDSFVQQSQAKEVKIKIDEMSAMMKKSLDNDADFEKRLTSVEEKVLENESDRLLSELFDCGNRCRRGIRLHPEEMDHIRVVYDKYSRKLKQNGTGATEMAFITEYYNHQTFPEYHSQN